MFSFIKGVLCHIVSSQQYNGNKGTGFMLHMLRTKVWKNWIGGFYFKKFLICYETHTLIVKWVSIMHIEIWQHKTKIQYKTVTLFSETLCQRKKKQRTMENWGRHSVSVSGTQVYTHICLSLHKDEWTHPRTGAEKLRKLLSCSNACLHAQGPGWIPSTTYNQVGGAQL